LVFHHLAGPTYFLYADSMKKSTTGIQKLRGRPKSGQTPIHALRLPEELRTKIDDWIATQPEPRPSRSEAIRRLLAEALGKPADADKSPTLPTPSDAFLRASDET
jgi:Arc/MetJ-type ribon-helix-helix transcriptional regulator